MHPVNPVIQALASVGVVILLSFGDFVPQTAAKHIPYRWEKLPAKIAHGSTTTITEFPFAVQLRITKGFIRTQCGGTIIRPDIVLTAAHCLRGMPSVLSGSEGAYSITVIAGEDRLNGYGASSQRRTVNKIRMQTNFKEHTLENDLAILVLDRAFEINKDVKPLALPAKRQVFTGEAQVCGWGNLDDSEWNYDSNEELRMAALPLLDDSACISFYQHDTDLIEYDKSIMLCAGGDRVDTCKGDSGGPLICSDNSQQYLCGVTSWGVGCRSRRAPGVYTRISAYLDWIENQIQELTG